MMAANGPCIVCGKPCGWGVSGYGARNDFKTTWPEAGERQFVHTACLPQKPKENPQ